MMYFLDFVSGSSILCQGLMKMMIGGTKALAFFLDGPSGRLDAAPRIAHSIV